MARPVQAAMASAAKFFGRRCGTARFGSFFAVGLVVPLVFAGSLLFLAALGIIGARVGGAGILRPTIRVTFALAMAVTAGIGAALGRVV